MLHPVLAADLNGWSADALVRGPRTPSSAQGRHRRCCARAAYFLPPRRQPLHEHPPRRRPWAGAAPGPCCRAPSGRCPRAVRRYERGCDVPADSGGTRPRAEPYRPAERGPSLLPPAPLRLDFLVEARRLTLAGRLRAAAGPLARALGHAGRSLRAARLTRAATLRPSSPPLDAAQRPANPRAPPRHDRGVVHGDPVDAMGRDTGARGPGPPPRAADDVERDCPLRRPRCPAGPGIGDHHQQQAHRQRCRPRQDRLRTRWSHASSVWSRRCPAGQPPLRRSSSPISRNSGSQMRGCANGRLISRSSRPLCQSRKRAARTTHSFFVSASLTRR